MFGRNAYQMAHLPATVVTDEMAIAIDRWVELYHNSVPWITKMDHLSVGLPALIAREVATMVTVEAEINVTNGGTDANAAKGSTPAPLNPRAMFIDSTLKSVRKQLAKQTEYACAFGGLVFKPYFDGEKVCIDYVNADNFYPTAYDSSGEIIGAVFIEKKRNGTDYFIRVESHELVTVKNQEPAYAENQETSRKVYIIKNEAFKSYNGKDFGQKIELTDVPDWANIQPETTIENVQSPLFAYFMIPNGNVIDLDSPLGVSVYARADIDGLFEEADKQLQRLSWEYNGGQMAIDASSDTFKTANGLPVLPEGKERLFRVNDLDSQKSNKGIFDIFNPNLRDDSYLKGLNAVLTRVEDACCIARGTYSDPNDISKTATELRISKQRTYIMVSSIQDALEEALGKLVVAIDALATLYSITPAGSYAVTYKWDDSILTDSDAERANDRQDVRDGVMSKVEYRMKWYNEDEDTAMKAIEGIKQENLTPEEIMGFNFPKKEPGSKFGDE